MRRLALLLLLVAVPARAQVAPDPVRGDHGMVVSAHRLASEVGVEILKQGGNAVDAAVAVGFALQVVYPTAGNIGGGGFMVIRKADGTATTFDYREKAPAGASRDMYLDSTGTPRTMESLVDHRAAGVPGSVAGLLSALSKYGTMTPRQVLAPAIRLARGHRLTYRMARTLNGERTNLSQFPGSRRQYVARDTVRGWQDGALFRQPELAATLTRIATSGRDGFYKGRTAALIVAEMKRGGGLITAQDLADYKAVERPPVTGMFRDVGVISMGPPSSGGVILIEMLNLLEGYPLRRMGWNSSAYVHRLTESMRRAYADRAEFLGDPDFVRVPTTGLTSKRYADSLRRTIDTLRATPSARVDHGRPVAYESPQTTHYSVVDRQGNAVSCTTTLNGGFGSYVTVEGAGFLLNNEMDDFSVKPGVPNMYGLIGREANAITPGKRMLSSMTPTILTRGDSLYMTVGTPGGSTIMTTVLQVVLNAVEFNMDVQQAITSARIHHQWLPDELRYEPFGLSADAVANLSRMGHRVIESRGYQGRAEGIMIGRGGVRLGGADPRGEDTAVGY